jgi:hypothetical protein
MTHIDPGGGLRNGLDVRGLGLALRASGVTGRIVMIALFLTAILLGPSIAVAYITYEGLRTLRETIDEQRAAQGRDHRAIIDELQAWTYLIATPDIRMRLPVPRSLRERLEEGRRVR